jgi:GDP-D-mannose dehydratase
MKWKCKTSFKQLVQEMMEHDLKKIKLEKKLLK